MALADISNIKATEIVIAGIRIEGWSDDEEVITFDPSNMVAKKQGADGLCSYGATNEVGGNVTLKLLANSPSVDALNDINKQQKIGNINLLSGTILYENGEVINMRRGVLMTSPNGYGQGKGAPSSLEYIFAFEEII